MRLTTVLLAALVGAASAIQVNPAQVNQLAAEVAAVALEHAEHAVAEESSLARSEESSSARSEESSAARSEASSVAAESSESSGKALATLEADLSALLLKKDSGKFHGDDLLKLNVEIELALQKIKSIQNRDVGRGEASAPAERTVLEEVMDPILAHLATLKKHREMAGLQEIDLRDLQANMARLGGMIDDYLGGNSCGNSCGGAPAASVTLVDSCGRAVCPPKQLVEAEEVKCGSACVVASTNGCTVASTCGPTVPTIVESCNADRGACAVESKSAITTCDECAALRDSCHSQCTRWGHPTCSNSCATQTQTCHSTCVARTVRHEAIVRLVKTQVNEVCAPGNGGKCPGDVPKTVPKGTLSDHNAAKFFF